MLKADYENKVAHVVGIDAFNISSGGGLTHLCEFISAIKNDDYRVKEIILWGSSKVLAKVPDRKFLQKIYVPALDKGLHIRLLWHVFMFKAIAEKAKCDVVFAPGGTDLSGFNPSVTMSRNMLPFEKDEADRYRSFFMRVKFFLLRKSWKISYKRTNGLIFLTKYAGKIISRKKNIYLPSGTKIVPHGVDARFFNSDTHLTRKDFTFNSPCRLIYVSIVDPYKHHWNVVHAVGSLRASGIPVVLDLVGPPGESLDRLKSAIHLVDPTNEFVNYLGSVPHESLQNYYKSADIGVFASTCENMPNILLEMMASGLPVASSHFGPMPEILGEDGTYFNPLDIDSISSSIAALYISPEKRSLQRDSNIRKARELSWERCADSTLDFLVETHINFKQ